MVQICLFSMTYSHKSIENASISSSLGVFLDDFRNWVFPDGDGHLIRVNSKHALRTFATFLRKSAKDGFSVHIHPKVCLDLAERLDEANATIASLQELENRQKPRTLRRWFGP